jgi:hypothetical protein
MGSILSTNGPSDNPGTVQYALSAVVSRCVIGRRRERPLFGTVTWRTNRTAAP